MFDLRFTLAEIVNERGYPVYIHEEYQIMVTWNSQSTFNLYRLREDGWENYDCFTNHDAVADVRQAERIAKEYLADEEQGA